MTNSNNAVETNVTRATASSFSGRKFGITTTVGVVSGVLSGVAHYTAGGSAAGGVAGAVVGGAVGYAMGSLCEGGDTAPEIILGSAYAGVMGLAFGSITAGVVDSLVGHTASTEVEGL